MSNKKQFLVAKGFLELSEKEQKELVDFASRYFEATPYQKTMAEQEVAKHSSVGPKDYNPCPCCGK